MSPLHSPEAFCNKDTNKGKKKKSGPKKLLKMFPLHVNLVDESYMHSNGRELFSTLWESQSTGFYATLLV